MKNFFLFAILISVFVSVPQTAFAQPQFVEVSESNIEATSADIHIEIQTNFFPILLVKIAVRGEGESIKQLEVFREEKELLDIAPRQIETYDYSLTGLSQGVEHTYRVLAVYATNEGYSQLESEIKEFTTLSPMETQPPPILPTTETEPSPLALPEARVSEVPSEGEIPGVASFVRKVNKLIINPLIALLFALALVFFLYGVVEFIASPADEDKRSKGKKHMLWGLIGMFIMFAVWGIIGILIRTFGIELPPGHTFPSGI